MQIKVKIISRASQNKIISDKNNFKIYITQVPEKGKANQQIINLLAKHFKIAKSNIQILSGLTSSNKIIKILK